MLSMNPPDSTDMQSRPSWQSHKRQKWKRVIIIGAFVMALTFIICTSISFRLIYKGVMAACINANREHAGNCSQSLIAYIKSDQQTFENKNKALWALGQLANKEALPFLKELESEISLEHPCDRGIQLCGLEVKKAIQWCSSGNLTSWMYRNQTIWCSKS